VNDQKTEKSALCSKTWSKLPIGSKEEEDEKEEEKCERKFSIPYGNRREDDH
jgi:hypothetical protein